MKSDRYLYKIASGYENNSFVDLLSSYDNLEDAIKNCKNGYYVFSSLGKIVFSLDENVLIEDSELEREIKTKSGWLDKILDKLVEKL